MKSYIWGLPTRIFHWLFVLFILILFISSDEDGLLRYHVAFGYGAGVLLLFRIVWGFAGPLYSRFSDWPLKKDELIEFIKNALNPAKEYPSHNPAASFVMLFILISAILATISGVLVFGIQESRGVFGFLNAYFYRDMDIFKEIHEFFSNLLLFFIVVHIAGVVIDRVFHPKPQTLKSIISGYKMIRVKDTKVSFLQTLFASLAFSFSVYIVIVSLSQNTTLTKSRFSERNYEVENPLYVEECASCHILYPPHLLTKKSWANLMDNLANHFGDDASLDAKDRDSIKRYLMDNAAEYSTRKSAYNIFKSTKDKKDIIAITKTPFWIKKHKGIKKSIFESKDVKSKANCKACHKRVEKGFVDSYEATTTKKGWI